MMMKNIKNYCAEWKAMLRHEIANLGRTPGLTIVQVGDVEASNRYVRNKIKDCEEIGIDVNLIKLPNDIAEKELIKTIVQEEEKYGCDGLIVQLPLPPHINVDMITHAIDEEVDVDGFKWNSPFYACTPLGIMRYVEDQMDLEGKDVCIIGRSDIVGKPLAQMMTDANATVTLCHSKTRNLYRHIFNADLIVCAVGKAKFLNCYPIHVPVIDVGINFNEEGKLVGDCYNTAERDVTPVPGGVGLLTRCALLDNVVKSATMRKVYEDGYFA